MPHEPVRPLLLSRYVKTSAESSSGFQNPEYLPVSSLFFRKCVKAVQRQNHVKRAVRKGQRPHIPLLKGHILQVQTFRLFLRLSHHIRRIIQAGNVRLGQCLVKRHGQNTGSHRHLQQPAGEMLRDAGQCLFQRGVVFRLVHIPHQAAYRFSAKGRAGDHTVIKIVAACQPIGAANHFFSFHVPSSLRYFTAFAP